MMEKEEMLIIYSAIECLEGWFTEEGKIRDNSMANTLVDSAKQILRSYLDDNTISMIAHNDGPISMRGLPENFIEEE